MSDAENNGDALTRSALDEHAFLRQGKMITRFFKPCKTQRELSLTYRGPLSSIPVMEGRGVLSPLCDDIDVYGHEPLSFAASNILPESLDPRLKLYVVSAVARARVDSGVARSGYPEHYPN